MTASRPAPVPQASPSFVREDEDQGTARYRAYVLTLLAAVTFFYQLDRNLMYVIQELIKIDFSLPDPGVGLVSGLAYGLANGLPGLPMGWLIDRANRAKLIAACISIWSGMTAFCGL